MAPAHPLLQAAPPRPRKADSAPSRDRSGVGRADRARDRAGRVPGAPDRRRSARHGHRGSPAARSSTRCRSACPMAGRARRDPRHSARRAPLHPARRLQREVRRQPRLTDTRLPADQRQAQRSSTRPCPQFCEPLRSAAARHTRRRQLAQSLGQRDPAERSGSHRSSNASTGS